jgi:hypothetical protein
MRSLVALLLVSTAACTTAAIEGPPGPDSVRERLAAPTQLVVSAAESTGSITASHYTHDGWQDGSIDVALDAGRLTASIDDAGELRLDDLVVALSPIDLPESVFGKPAQLRHVKLALAQPATTAVTWTDDDDATADDLAVQLDLSWSIFIDGGDVPLGTQHLAPLPVMLSLAGGAGDHVEASIGVDASGTLWSWAGLLEVKGLALSLSAGTAD